MMNRYIRAFVQGPFFYPCIVLLIIYILSLIFIPKNEEWVENYFSNINSEILGILLTIVIVELAITSNEIRNNRIRQQIAFNRLRETIVIHLNVFAYLYKVSASHPISPIRLPENLFSENFYSSITHLDLSKPSISLRGINWAIYLQEYFDTFNSSITDVLSRYIIYLEQNQIQLLEDLVNKTNSGFVDFINIIVNSSPNKALFQNIDILNSLKSYCNIFANLIIEYNTLFRMDNINIDATIWDSTSLPYYGSGRI